MASLQGNTHTVLAVNIPVIASRPSFQRRKGQSLAKQPRRNICCPQPPSHPAYLTRLCTKMQQQSYSQVAKAEPAWAASLLRSIFMSRHLSKALNKEEPAPSRAEEACHQAIMFRGVLLPTSLWGESLPVFFLNASLANPVKEFFTAYFIKQLPAPCPSLWPTHTTPQITQLGKRRRPFSFSQLLLPSSTQCIHWAGC